LDTNYVKLFSSKEFFGNDGSSWTFAVLKKRMLIQKGRERFVDAEEELIKEEEKKMGKP
jgi:hypothetical protein